MIVEKELTFINTGLFWSSQDGIYHTYYVRIVFVVQEKLLRFICDGFHLQDFLWLGLT